MKWYYMKTIWNQLQGGYLILVSLSIKNVSDDIMVKLKGRAAKNHRSLQGEIVSILEDALIPKSMSLKGLEKRISMLGLKTPDEATAIVRGLRDGRNSS